MWNWRCSTLGTVEFQELKSHYIRLQSQVYMINIPPPPPAQENRALWWCSYVPKYATRHPKSKTPFRQLSLKKLKQFCSLTQPEVLSAHNKNTQHARNIFNISVFLPACSDSRTDTRILIKSVYLLRDFTTRFPNPVKFWLKPNNSGKLHAFTLVSETQMSKCLCERKTYRPKL